VSDVPATLRVDKWLWAARFFKTRSLATHACAGGKVEINGESAKPARLLRPGDRVTVTRRGGPRLGRVLALSERRGPAGAARTLWEDLTPPAPPRLRFARPPHRAAGSGRPTKLERRQTDRLRDR